jgi:diguanylate cyclase (GGDEF)-like protein
VDFRRELPGRTRRTGVIAGIVGVVAYLAWAGLDRALEPAHAAEFLPIRITVAIVLAVGTALLAMGLARGRAAEWTAFTFVAAVQCGIAWMIPRVEIALPAYVLGYTLAIYGSALLLEWYWTYNVAVVVLSCSALALADVTAPHPMTAGETVMAATYVVTSSVISLVGQWIRYRISRSEFVARAEAEAARADAEREREHNLDLLRQLDHLSRHDPLTGLPNRRLLDDTLARELANAERRGTPLALVLLDIDHFKHFNDTLGHQAGDRVLQVVSTTLGARLRRGDLAARYGGEEFALVLPGMGAEDVLPVVEALRDAVHEASSATDPRLAVTVSAGTAVFPVHAGGAVELLRAADVALYEAKDRGRDQARLAAPTSSAPAFRSFS